MPITAVLTVASPHMLRYLLLASTASATASPELALTIGNDAAATPDLRTDATTGRTNGQVASAPLLSIIRSRIDGIPLEGVAAGVLTQNLARGRLNSDNSGPGSAEPHNLSAEMYIAPRGVTGRLAGNTGPRQWTCDASVDVSGDPVAVVRAVSGIGQGSSRAILTIRARHSMHL